MLVLASLVSAAVGCGGSQPGDNPQGTIVWSSGDRLVVSDLSGAVVGRVPISEDESVALSPDGTQLAVSGAGLRLVNIASSTSTQLLPPTASIEELGVPVFSPSGRYLAVSSNDPSCIDQQRLAGVALVDLGDQTGTTSHAWMHPQSWREGDFTRFVDVYAVSNDGDLGVEETRFTDGECRYQELRRERYWRLPHGAAEPSLVLDEAELGAIEPSPDTTRIAYATGGGDECDLQITDERGEARELVAHQDFVPLGCWTGGFGVAWSPDSGTLYHSHGTSVIARDVRAGEERLLATLPEIPTDCEYGQSCLRPRVLDRSNDGRWLLVAHDDPWDYAAAPKLYLVSTKDGELRPIQRPEGSREPASAVLD